MLNSILTAHGVKPVEANWYMDAPTIVKAVMESVVLVLVVVLLNQYVIGNKSIFNTTASSIASTVVPIIQAALLIVAIFGAIAVIYEAAKSGLTSTH